MASQKKEKNYVVTPEVRINWPTLFEPRAYEDSDKAKYSVQIIIEKKDIAFFKKLVDTAIVKKWSDKQPKANSDAKPLIVDEYRNESVDKSEVYSGCYARICLGPYALDGKFGKGISFSLIGVMKTRDGERLDNYEPVEAEEALAGIEMRTGADDPSNYDEDGDGLPDYMH